MPMTHVEQSLRFLMRKLADAMYKPLCSFCGLRPGTHQLLIEGVEPVSCCDNCDDAELSIPPVV